MTTPTKTDNQFYIRLVSQRSLEKPEVVAFYKFVKGVLPSGVLSSIQVERPNYGLDTVRLIHKTGESGAPVYEIPLSRNLTENEFDLVKYAFQGMAKEGQELESSTVVIPNARHLPTGESHFEPDNYDIFCDTLAKYQHSNWCSERTEAGWRYGADHNPQAKTSPLLRPWHDLPSHYQRKDKNLPNKIFEILEDMGYVIIPRTELDKLTKKKR